MILFMRVFIITAIIVLTGHSYYKYQLMHKLKHNPKYRDYENEKDTCIKKFSDTRFTNHYILVKNILSKEVIAYDDLLWVHIEYIKRFVPYAAALVLVGHTVDGKRARLVYVGSRKEKILEEAMAFIKDKNPNCILGDSEENLNLYRSIVKY